jgi:O-antigen ligase
LRLLGREVRLDWPLAAAVVILLVFSGFWVMAVTGPSEELAAATPDTEALNQKLRYAFYPPYLFIATFTLMRFGGVIRRFLTTPGALFVLLAPFLSLLWSIDPSVTMRKSIALLLTMVGGVAMLEVLGWRRMVLAFALAYAVTLVVSYAFGVALPAYGRMWIEVPGAWRGAWSHKNLLGLNMALGSIAFVNAAILYPRWRLVFSGLAGLAVVLVLLSTSKTALMAAVIGVGVMALVAMIRKGPLCALTAGYGFGVAAVIFILTSLYAPDVIFGVLGKDATLTGRTRIWGAVMRQIAERPLTGYGFGAVWTNTDRWSPIGQISREQGFTVA